MMKKSLIAMICLLMISQTSLAFFQNIFNSRQKRQRQRNYRQERPQRHYNRRSRYRRGRPVAASPGKQAQKEKAKALPAKIKEEQISDEKIFAEFKKPNYSEPSKGIMVSRTFTEKDKKLHYEMTIKYPQLGGAKNFNKATEKLAYTAAYKFKKTIEQLAQKEDRDVPKELGNSLLMTYNTTLKNDGVVSVKFTLVRFIAGQVHPTPSYKVLNYNLKNGKKLDLDQLFQKRVNYLETLSQYCKQQLTSRKISDKLWIAEGTKPIPHNYQIWNMTDKGLVITFAPHQVAAYVLGPQEVTIPFALLSAELNASWSSMLTTNSST